MHHGIRAGGYPQPHRDRFDRLLAAQAELEGLPLVSFDHARAPSPAVCSGGGMGASASLALVD
ncbi:hypothetical protein [Synechococcus sp. BA-132 BA5]|uniref:hypothetical protein n=1 Tax=Synechococcus sp. BA-132 BA5 TaxID=3110252 RepID=UPI002B2209D9|nr:hypothetical protein [Synechococcus sp. BA-132 BA5]MEA5415768.1 hypothetical protein [Synechococcus sp. BA-132 BA5]